MPTNASSYQESLRKHKLLPHEARGIASPHSAGIKAHEMIALQNNTEKPVHTKRVKDLLIEAEERQKKEDAPAPEMIIKPKFYQTGWFNTILFTVATTAMLPMIMGAQLKDLQDMALSYQSTRDAMKIESALTTALAPPAPVPLPAVEPKHPTGGPEKLTQKDIDRLAVESEQRIQEVVSKGSDYSIRYIDEEATRLDQMAREYDAKNRTYTATAP